MQTNGELDALIVRNIADLEAAYLRATGAVDDRLWLEIARVAQDAAESAGLQGRFDGQDWILSIRPDAWASTGAKAKPDFSFDLGGVDPNEEAETWIGAITGDNPAGVSTGLVFVQNLLNPRPLQALYQRETKLMAQLGEAGFRRTDNGKRLYLPVRVDREKLAQAFADDIFDEALQPLADAITQLGRNLPLLDRLVRAIRAEADAG